MKNLLVICIFAAAALGCDLSRFTNSASSGNTGTPTPSSSRTSSPDPNASATPTKKTDENKTTSQSTFIPTLRKSEGKYPSDLKLFSNPEVVSRLKNIMGGDYAAMKAKFNTESPIEIVDGIAKLSACEAHNCGANMYYLFVDLDKDNINVIHVENTPRTYAEHGKITLPQKFADDVNGN